MSPRKKEVVSPMEFILLGYIYQNPMHGYDVFKMLNKPGGISMIWHINQSNLYAMLDGLENRGYLFSQLLQMGNSPTRKEFHITSSGTTVFEQWVREPVLHGREMRQIFLAKLFFASKIDSETARSLVHKQLSIAHLWLEEIEANRNFHTVEDEFDHLVLNSRKIQIQGWLDWLSACARSQIVGQQN